MTVTLLCYIVTHWLLLGRYTTVVIYIMFLQLTAVFTNITIMQSRHENEIFPLVKGGIKKACDSR